MRLVIVYQDPRFLHQLQLTAGTRQEYLEHSHGSVPGATKGTPWDALCASLEELGWKWVDRGVARQPADGEQPEPPAQRIGCDITLRRFHVETTWASWPQTWPVVVLDNGSRPFMRVVELDDNRPVKRTAWANVAWWPGRGALSALSTSSGLRWGASAEEVAHTWVALTSLPWPWPLPGSAA